MQCRLKVEKPEDMVYTVTITASAKEWEALRDQISDVSGCPACDLRYVLNDLLSQARKIYWASNPKDGDA